MSDVDPFDPAKLSQDEEHVANNGVPAEQEADANAALTTLFAENPQYNLDMIDGPGELTPDEEGSKPGTAQGTPATPGDNTTPSTGPTRPKRPGTSRVNMLTRGGACEFCKRRKLKCSADLPQCATCRRANRECVYSQKKQRSRMKQLEEKVSELESRLQERPDYTPATVIPELILGLGDGMILDTGDLTPGAAKRAEPDLMTLADAAAADTGDRAPWEGMTPQAIASEMVKAVCEQSKGVGEKICAHL